MDASTVTSWTIFPVALEGGDMWLWADPSSIGDTPLFNLYIDYIDDIVNMPSTSLAVAQQHNGIAVRLWLYTCD